MALRKHSSEIEVSLESVTLRNTEFTSINNKPIGSIVEELRGRFILHLNPQQAREYVNELIDQSMDSFTTNCYDRYQRCFVGIF